VQVWLSACPRPLAAPPEGWLQMQYDLAQINQHADDIEVT
jgi:hypothetical protein